MGTFNILSLDGGGSWALLQVRALQSLYGADARGHDVLRQFRLVTATSGGAIVAAGLWRNFRLSELAQVFLNESIRRSLFAPLPFYSRTRLWRLVGIGPKYRAAAKLTGIKEVLGSGAPGSTDLVDLQDARMSGLQRDFRRSDGLPTDLVVIAYDYDRARTIFLRSNALSSAGSQQRETTGQAKDTTLAMALHASSHAPVNYFAATAEIVLGSGEKVHAWDGAVAGYNNPMLAGITEALANGVDRRDIRVLSLGTGKVALPPQQPGVTGHPWLFARPVRGSLIRDVERLATSILSNPPDFASYVSYIFLAERPAHNDPPESPARSEGPIVRMSPLIQPLTGVPGTAHFVPPRVDAATEFGERDFGRLVAMGLDAVSSGDVELIDKLARGWLSDCVHNQPILASSSTLVCELGHRWFSQARKRAGELGLAPAVP
jgi:hypothetical protein